MPTASVFIKEKSGAVLDAATGQAALGPPADLKAVRLNNRLRRTVEASLGGLTLMAADPAKRYEIRAGRVQVARNKCAAGARCRARQGNRQPRQEGAHRSARGGHRLSGGLKGERQSRSHRHHPRARPTRTRAAMLAGLASGPDAAGAEGRNRRPLRRSTIGSRCGARCRMPGTAFRSARCCCSRHWPRDHVRRDGRHQHGRTAKW